MGKWGRGERVRRKRFVEGREIITPSMVMRGMYITEFLARE
jgi:hypothetical protein